MKKKEIEQAIKNFATKKSPETNDFTGKYYQRINASHFQTLPKS